MARSGKRITRVTTKAGDAGTTTLADGSKVSKTHPLMHAIGDVDELNSLVGLLVTELTDAHALREPMGQLQQELFDVGAHLATVGAVGCPDAAWLEALVAELNEALPPLTEFVIPGGSRSAALAHVCRTACRRAERSLWALVSTADETSGDYTDAARYTNRLSDLLFVMARSLNREGAAGEPQWRGSKGEPSDIA